MKDSVKAAPSLLDTSVPNYRVSPPHSSKKMRKTSMDELTKEVFPVLKGTDNHEKIAQRRGLEKEHLDTSVNKARRGGTRRRSCTPVECSHEDGGDGACEGCIGERWDYSGPPLKQDPLVKYKIPKMRTGETPLHPPVTSGDSSTHSSFDCVSTFELDKMPNDPLMSTAPSNQPETGRLLQGASSTSEGSTPVSPNSGLSLPPANNTRKWKNPSKGLDENSCEPRRLVKKALDVYFDEGRITNRQFKRILERATRKVEEGLAQCSCVSEPRVKKLVADYVEAYEYHGTWT